MPTVTRASFRRQHPVPLSLVDVKILAFDGSDVIYEVRCDGCGHIQNLPAASKSATGRSTSFSPALLRGRSRDICEQRGWRRLEAAILCPHCLVAAIA